MLLSCGAAQFAAVIPSGVPNAPFWRLRDVFALSREAV
jgi:hypothetical protein